MFPLDFMSEHDMRFNGNETASLSRDRDALARIYRQAILRAQADHAPI
ncbi:MAG: hypothetical protein MO852_10370 [Candidatus Devosia euplotis]|nr:hypothetical protein [Candidatus Devosia euplotis]